MSEPYELMSNITDFLSLNPVSRDDAERWFLEKANRLRVSSSFKHGMREDTRDILKELYRPYNEMLAELLGDDRFLFKDED